MPRPAASLADRLVSLQVRSVATNPHSLASIEIRRIPSTQEPRFSTKHDADLFRHSFLGVKSGVAVGAAAGVALERAYSVGGSILPTIQSVLIPKASKKE